jgi:hypothetical protein
MTLTKMRTEAEPLIERLREVCSNMESLPSERLELIRQLKALGLSNYYVAKQLGMERSRYNALVRRAIDGR